MLAIILLAVHYLKVWIGTGGVYAAAALSGVTDVDALTISVSKLIGDDLTALSGATAIFIAASVNTAVKAGISMAVGGKALGRRVISVYAAVLIAGVACLWFVGWGCSNDTPARLLTVTRSVTPLITTTFGAESKHDASRPR